MDYRETPHPTDDDELQHYGVKGMRWGVRRAQKKLSKATTKEAEEKAIRTLNRHRQKGTKKLKKLSAEASSLKKQRDKQIVKDDVKAAEYHQKALAKRAKSGKRRLSDKKRVKLILEAESLEARAETIKANSEVTKRRIEKNQTMQNAFKEQIDLIDATLVADGKRYLKGA